MNIANRIIRKCSILYMIVLSLSCYILHVSSQTITVNWDDTRQEIDGFGASAAFKQADNLKKFPIETRTKILDLLFSQTGGIGLSMVRNMVGDGSMNEWGNEIDGPIETIYPEKGKWNFDAVDEQIWFMKEAGARGCERFYSTVWSPPRWMKTNNSCIKGGSLKKENYGDYAVYLYQYVTEYMKKRNGIDIYAISIANEPDFSASYSSCRWSGNQFRDFVRDHIGPLFKDEHKIGTKIIIGEEMGWTEHPALPTLNDPKAVKYLDIVGSHNYKPNNYRPFSTTKGKNKRVWQTEVSNLKNNDRAIGDGLKWARQIHSFLTKAEGNSWCYWWTICYKVNPEKGEALININTSNNTYFTNKRLFTMGNYSRFVRPGWYRISTSTSSSNNVYVTAFKNIRTNDFAVVAINDNASAQTRSFKLDGHDIASVTPYVTTVSKELAEGNPISLSNGSFSTSLPAQSVTTFYSKSESTPVKGRGKERSLNTDDTPDLSISVSNAKKLTLKCTYSRISFNGTFAIYTISGKKLTHYTLRNKKGEDTASFSLPEKLGAGIYYYRFINKKSLSTGVFHLTGNFH